MLTFQSVQEERLVRARNANALLTSLLTAMEHARPLVPRQTAQHVEISARSTKNARTRSARCNALMDRSFVMGNARTNTGVPTKTAQNAEMHANTGKHAARTRSAYQSASMEKSFARACARRILGAQTKTAPNATTSAQRERHARTRSVYQSASMEKSFAKMCARRTPGAQTKTAPNVAISAQRERHARTRSAYQNASMEKKSFATASAKRLPGVRTKTAQNAEIPARTERLASTSNANAPTEKRTESARNNEKASCTAQPSDLKEKVVSFVIPLLAYHKRSKNM